MKRFFWMTLIGGSAAVLAGCPVYPDNGSYRVCNQYGCYSCPNDSYSEDCVGLQCATDADCGNGYSCSTDGQCVSGGTYPNYDASTGYCSNDSQCPIGESCGAGLQCQPGDCSNNGCPTGLVCKLSGGTLTCVSPTNGDAGQPPPKDAGTTPIDSGNDVNAPIDAAAAIDAPPDAPDPFTGCHDDSQCASTGAGAKCLDGACVAATDQCFDTTQCPNNEACVDGVCTATCSPTMQCSTGYSCTPLDTTDGGSANGVCSGNPMPCGTGGGTCANGTTCVDQHCVDPCGDGGACGLGLVCVDHGCIPDQQPAQFVCQTEGKPGDGLNNDCAVGSLCLHHQCYITCDPDAGASACQSAAEFNICKSVTTGTGTYSICGSDSNLGNQCNPTQGQTCTDPLKPVCIDGFCN